LKTAGRISLKFTQDSVDSISQIKVGISDLDLWPRRLQLLAACRGMLPSDTV